MSKGMNVEQMLKTIAKHIPTMRQTGKMSDLRFVKTADRGKSVMFGALADVVNRNRTFKLVSSGGVYELNFMNQWEQTADAKMLTARFKGSKG